MTDSPVDRAERRRSEEAAVSATAKLREALMNYGVAVHGMTQDRAFRMVFDRSTLWEASDVGITLTDFVCDVLDEAIDNWVTEDS